MPLPTEQERLWQLMSRRVGHAVKKYGLIADGDRILVGLSGGKDSLLLLEMLGRRMLIRRPQFEVEAVHVRMENVKYESDCTYLQQFCDRLGVRLHVLTTSFEDKPGNSKPPCFLCSWYRRKAIFDLAQQLGCNKIALGHHLDDLIHTALMNLFSQGHFSTMPALLKMRKMPLAIIRPLCTVNEADIARYARLQDYRPQRHVCPHEHESLRDGMARLFSTVEQLTAEARYSVLNALESDGRMTEGED
ncbi:MAG: tRNA 2-thiocytidine biosynthesis TtcA family protein [Prevotella sp.]